MNRLPRFYPVVDSAALVRDLAAAGARLVQLRIKQADDDRLRREIADALAACRRHGAQLVVNDHWELAIEQGADFVHLGQEDLDGADLPALRRHGLRLGVSTHDRHELARARGVRPDYVALGPIWPTALKAMPWAPQGVGRIGEWKRAIGTLPLVAIGGITLERAPACLAAGADAVAMVGDVVRHADPPARARAWLDALGSLA
ncbi:thiamine phosphate synthase [Frateuria sp. MAH-13]|uniref:Thiamine-phosphate synthase n=1 Tax=Frateuria flava TaxID=2821489 RepID=A0ABS4DLQ0_9GAMM|nr:thiamine phosphate synthase [Frateuria flava]MBP1473980.1 thiamine phosphate synthase [Frateuria flava]